LEPQFIKLPIIKGAEFRRRTTEVPDKPELRGHLVNGVTKAGFLCKREAMLGFALHLNQPIARREQDCVQAGATVRGEREVADLGRDFVSATQQFVANPDMRCPGHQLTSKIYIGPDLEGSQPPRFDQFIAKLAESKSGLVVTETRSGDHAEPYVGHTRAVGVADVEAEINGLTDGQGKKVRIRMPDSRQYLGDNPQGRKGARVAHQGQLGELLDRVVPQM